MANRTRFVINQFSVERDGARDHIPLVEIGMVYIEGNELTKASRIRPSFLK